MEADRVLLVDPGGKLRVMRVQVVLALKIRNRSVVGRSRICFLRQSSPAVVGAGALTVRLDLETKIRLSLRKKRNSFRVSSEIRHDAVDPRGSLQPKEA